MRRWSWSSAVLVATLASASAQEVRVALPQPLADRVAEALRAAWKGAPDRAWNVRAVAPQEPFDPASARAAIVVATGIALQQRGILDELAEMPTDAALSPTLRVTRDRRIALPWSLGYSVCGDVANVTQRDGKTVTWEDLALSFGLGDRLRIALPSCDRGPWLLAMHETLRRGGGDNAVFGVWTAFDARIAAYEPDYASMVAAASRDPGLAVTLPTAIAAVGDAAKLARLPMDGALPIGLAVRDGAGKDAAFSLLLEILEPSVEFSVREQALLSGPGVVDAEVPSDSVEPAFAHFSQRIQGQGRHVERVADWLDFAALGAMALVMLVLLLRSRRKEST
jgi:hypothetical protein